VYDFGRIYCPVGGVDWIKGMEDIRVVGVDSGIERARVGEHWLCNFFSPCDWS